VHRPVGFSETPATSLSTLNNKHWQMNQRDGATKFDNPERSTACDPCCGKLQRCAKSKSTALAWGASDERRWEVDMV
jgi:hypothetical protein